MMRIVSRGMAITLAALSLTASAVAAPVETVLYRFKGIPDGQVPLASLIDEDGALYGTTQSGGIGCAILSPFGCGTVFKVTPPVPGQTTWTETMLYRFCSQPGCSDGYAPSAGLIAGKDGALYGTTSNGGSSANSGSGYGTVFKLMPPAPGQTAWTETVLYRFKGGSDGWSPGGGLISDEEEGVLYGTTLFGGSSNTGTVFKLTPPAPGQTAWTETVLYRFQGGSDGAYPQAALIFDKDGALFGTTPQGGSGFGTVFKLTPPAPGQTAWTETVPYRFQGGSDGASPFYAGVIAGKDGALYGTTLQGGIPGSPLIASPRRAVVLWRAKLGLPTTPFGAGAGTVFKLTPPATGEANWTETVLYRFCSQPNCSDGSFPYADLIADKEGALYGTTGNGGSSANNGTVFKLTPPVPGQTAWTGTVLYSFKGIPDGASPWAGLIANNAGALYGTTLQGGINGNIEGGYGTVFKLTARALTRK